MTVATIFPIARKVVLTLVLLLSFAVLGISANMNALAAAGYRYVFHDVTWTVNATFGIVVAAINILSLIILITVDLIRTGVFTSMVIVELIWLSLLCALWAAAGGYTASFCAAGMCLGLSAAIEALCFINSFFLIGYTGCLLGFALSGSRKGLKTWTSSVQEGDFFGPAPGKQREPPRISAPVVRQYTRTVPSKHGYPSTRRYGDTSRTPHPPFSLYPPV